MPQHVTDDGVYELQETGSASEDANYVCAQFEEWLRRGLQYDPSGGWGLVQLIISEIVLPEEIQQHHPVVINQSLSSRTTEAESQDIMVTETTTVPATSDVGPQEDQEEAQPRPRRADKESLESPNWVDRIFNEENARLQRRRDRKKRLRIDGAIEGQNHESHREVNNPLSTRKSIGQTTDNGINTGDHRESSEAVTDGINLLALAAGMQNVVRSTANKARMG